MRFVRAVVARGEVIAIMDSDLLYEPGQGIFPFEPHEIVEVGLVEDDGAWTDLEGNPTSLGVHLWRRLEPDGRGGVRAKSGQQLPVIHDCPTSKNGVLERLHERGPEGIPERAAHWLEFMELLSGEEMEAAGLPRLPIAAAAEFDAIRVRRDPSYRPRIATFKRRLRERALVRQAAANAVKGDI